VPIYLYTAKTQTGQTKTDSMEAPDKHELAAILRQQGLVLISAHMPEGIKDKSSSKWLSLQKILQRFGKISLVEKMIFTQHLSIMIKAGLSLNQSLRVLADQTKSPKFKRTINQIEKEVREGQSLSKSLSKHPTIFDNLYVNMVQVGETGGNLENVLNILTEQMRKDHELLSRIKGAMTYPIVIIVTMIGVGILMMIKVIPKLTAIFTELNMELPLSTRFIIGLSNFLQKNSLLGLAILIGLFFLVKMAMKNKDVKKILHKIYLVLPITGSITKKINSARFARTLSSLIESGVAIVKSMQIVAGTLNNVNFRDALIISAEQVQKGKDLSTSLAKYSNLYTPMVIQMIKIGEETGSLSDVLKNLADFYEEEINNITKNLSSVIEPIIMVVVGAAVGFFAISMIQPMYSMIGGV